MPDTNNLIAIQVWGSSGHLRIYNIYNDCHHDDSLDALDAHLQTHQGQAGAALDDFMLWGGDFNRHHPLWDEERNHHLFTPATIQAAGRLLEGVADHNMVMILPKDIPTLEAKATKNWTHPDNVFCSTGAEGLVVSCDTNPCL